MLVSMAARLFDSLPFYVTASSVVVTFAVVVTVAVAVAVIVAVVIYSLRTASFWFQEP